MTKQYQAEPGQQFEWRDETGTVHQLKADDKGIVKATTIGEERLAAAFGLMPSAGAKAKEE